MKPITFPEVNTVFAVDQPEYQALPSHKSNAGIVTTCWELTEEELEKLKESKCIFLSVMTFNQNLQPQYLTLNKEDAICLQKCESCGIDKDIENMHSDEGDCYFCQECYEVLEPVMKEEYEVLKAKGEID